MQFAATAITIQTHQGSRSIAAMSGMGSGLAYHHVDGDPAEQAYVVTHMASGRALPCRLTPTTEVEAQRWLELVATLVDWRQDIPSIVQQTSPAHRYERVEVALIRARAEIDIPPGSRNTQEERNRMAAVRPLTSGRRNRMDKQGSILCETPGADRQDHITEESAPITPGIPTSGEEHPMTTEEEHATLPLAEEAPQQDDSFTASTVPPQVVEGTIVESTLLSTQESGEEPSTPGQPQWQRSGVFRVGLLITWAIPLLLVVLLLAAQVVPGLAGPLSRLVPGLLPTATVTIIPVSADLRVTSTITAVIGTANERRSQVQARLVSVTTPEVAQTIPTTGKGHTPATHATGTVTFYNEASYEQTIAAGTVLAGADGVRIAPDAPAVVPAGNPPRFGIATVPAHAVQTGPTGNIPAYDVNGMCCAAGIAVKNTTVFSGGQNARDYPAVAQRDLDSVVDPLTTTLTRSARDTFQAQVHPNEQEVGSTRCTPTIHTDHPVGSEASQVTVAISVTCHGEVYDAQGAKVLAATQLAQQAMMQLGSSYSSVDGVTTTITQVHLLDTHRGSLALAVEATGIWTYQISEARLHAFARLIAGKSTRQAKTLLLNMQGIRAVTIALAGGSGTALPTNPDQITMQLLIVVGL